MKRFYQRERKQLAVSRFFSKSLTWLLVFLLTFVFTVSWGHAQDNQPIPPQNWQLKGIMAALDDSDPKIWVLALDKLSRYKIDGLKPPLQISYPKKSQRIVKLLDYEKNSSVQSAAVKALGKMGAKEQVDKIVSLLSSPYSDVQEAAAVALGELKAKEQVDKIVPLLSSQNSSVQSAAAVALGALEAKEYADQIAFLLLPSRHKNTENK